MNNILKQHAQTLHLSGLLDSLQLRLQEAEANRLPYAQFLELLFQDEINVRHQRFINRRHKQAEFRELRSLENFDFSFNPTINRALIYELATGQFVAQRAFFHPGDTSKVRQARSSMYRVSEQQSCL
jgi:DNA replication protein DnaC